MSRAVALIAPIIGSFLTVSTLYLASIMKFKPVDIMITATGFSFAGIVAYYFLKDRNPELATPFFVASVLLFLVPFFREENDYLKTFLGVGWGRINGKYYILGTNVAGVIAFALPVALFLLTLS